MEVGRARLVRARALLVARSRRREPARPDSARDCRAALVSGDGVGTGAGGRGRKDVDGAGWKQGGVGRGTREMENWRSSRARARARVRGSHFAQLNDGLPLVSFEGGGREGGREWSTLPACACACLFGRSLPLSSSKIVPSLARSLTTTRLPSLPPSLSFSLRHNTASSVCRPPRFSLSSGLSFVYKSDGRFPPLRHFHLSQKGGRRRRRSRCRKAVAACSSLFSRVDGDWKTEHLLGIG